MKLKDHDILHVAISTRVYYFKGALCLSSYLKCYPSEEVLSLNKSSELLFCLIDGKRTLLQIKNYLNEHGFTMENDDIDDWCKNLIEKSFIYKL